MKHTHDEPDAFYALLGERMYIARTKRGITQAVLARQVGLSRTSITKIEAGKQKIHADTLYELMKVLGSGIFPTVKVSGGSLLQSYARGYKDGGLNVLNRVKSSLRVIDIVRETQLDT